MSIPKVTELITPGSTYDKNHLDRHKRAVEDNSKGQGPVQDNSNYTLEHRENKQRRFCEEGGM